MNIISCMSLNIGNPSLERAQRQCEWLVKRPEDVFVLTETKNSRGCKFIEEYFVQYGFDLFSFNSETKYEVNFPKSETNDLGVMIISKYPMDKLYNYYPVQSVFYSRQTKVIIKKGECQLGIDGVYVPSRDRSEDKISRKKTFIDRLKKYIDNKDKKKSIIMGDFNIIERKHFPHYSTFYEWEYEFYDFIIEQGYIDAYKHYNGNKLEHSWVGRTKNGYRYDYCFVSKDLIENIVSCDFVHETREIKLTDHSAVTVKLAF